MAMEMFSEAGITLLLEKTTMPKDMEMWQTGNGTMSSEFKTVLLAEKTVCMERGTMLKEKITI